MTYYLRDYLIVNNKPVKTIHLELGKPRVRVTLDETKWVVLGHFADSGSIISLLITPKEKKDVVDKENIAQS